MSPHVVPLLLLIGFRGAQPLPVGPPSPVPVIEQCGCPPDPSGAPSDTCPSGALEFRWRPAPYVVRWEYQLTGSTTCPESFVSVPGHVHSVVFPPETRFGCQSAIKTFTLRAVGRQGDVNETSCTFHQGFPPDTWLAGPDPSDPSLLTKPNGERYALLVNGRLDAPIIGSLLSDDSVNVLPSQRAERRTFFEVWKDTVFARTDGDTVHMNSWVLIHSGGFDKDSPYSVHVTDLARQLPGFPGGPVLTPGPPNGSPVAFRMQVLTELWPTNNLSVEAISNPYPVFDPVDVFNNPRIGGYDPLIQSGRAYAFTFAVDGNNTPDRRIGAGVPGAIDPVTLVKKSENGTASPYELSLRRKVLAFCVDRAPIFDTGSSSFIPGPGATFTSATWNLRLVATDEDPFLPGTPPGGPAGITTLRRRVRVHGHDSQGMDFTYVDTATHLDAAFSVTVPPQLAPGPCSIEVELCDCEQCEFLQGSGRCVTRSFPVTYAPTGPIAHAAAAKPAIVTELLAPYPNPARNGAAIGFRLAKQGRVELELFDLAGHRVRRIESGAWSAGDHTIAWDGQDGAGRRIPAGLYLVRMRADGVETRKKLLVAP